MDNMINNVELQHDILMRSIKILDIGYIAVLYFTIAHFLSIILDRISVFLFGHIRHDKRKTKTTLYMEILFQIILTGVCIYIGRNIIMYIPFPLDGYNNYDHFKVKELTTGAFLNVFIFSLQKTLQSKIKLL